MSVAYHANKLQHVITLDQNNTKLEVRRATDVNQIEHQQHAGGTTLNVFSWNPEIQKSRNPNIQKTRTSGNPSNIRICSNEEI